MAFVGTLGGQGGKIGSINGAPFNDRRNTAALTVSRKWELAVMVALPVCVSVACRGARAPWTL